MSDPTEAIRRQEAAEININPNEREGLEAKHGQVWDTKELQEDFQALSFGAPYIIVKRKSDGQKGSLQFQHSPRYYFNFREA